MPDKSSRSPGNNLPRRSDGAQSDHQGQPVKVDYMMRHNGEAWLISDIYLDGAISEVATRRSEFSTILKNEGIDGLIAALNRKADILTGTTAKAL